MSARRRLAVAGLGVIAMLAGRDFGPAVGTPMPAFELHDQNGTARSLKSLLGPKGALILFFRSADWWPYCKAQLVELERSREALAKQGLGLAAVSYDSPAVLQHFAQRKGIHFPLLSDTDSKTIRSLNIINDTVPRDSANYGIPYPGLFLVDARGRITSKYFEDDFRDRYTAAAILARKFGLATAEAKSDVQGKQLSLTSSASTAAVTAGERIVLSLDIDLKPNMHVYAPGAEGYISMDWKMKDSPAGLAHEVSLPPSEKLYLKAIDETAPVYRGHFRLIRDLTIGQDGAVAPLLDPAGNLALEGSLRYQACDDRVCYIPQELPIRWTLRYLPPDRERVPADLQRKAPPASPPGGP